MTGSDAEVLDVRKLLVVLVAVVVGAVPLPGYDSGDARAAGAAASPFVACDRPGSAIRVGVVTCMREHAPDLGGTTAFSYFVPRGCAPRLHRRCPTLYLLHGFGGDYTSMLGTAAAPSAWVSALASQPPVAPEHDASPWDEADPAQWKPAAALDFVLVAPDGRTVPGGYGPEPMLESFWTDWNPRYAKGGADQRYATPAPRFSDYVHRELVRDVQRRLPVGRGRDYRALAGTSLGGYGSYAIGLTHPDAWASLGAVSGIMNILLVHGLDASPSGNPGAEPPTLTVPTPAGGAVPLPLLPSQARGFAAATYAFGDPSGDNTYYRGRMPVDLALNANARHGSRQSVAIRGFSNDTVARRPADYTSMPEYEVAEAFEDLVFVTNRDMNRAFTDAKVAATYQLHPGIHSDTYWNPWLREQLVAQYDAVRHWHGGGAPAPKPRRFYYRSTAKRFAVWGWHVRVRRPASEFLELDHVTCRGFAVRGSGRLTVTRPRRCGGGQRTVHLDLGTGSPLGPTATREVALTGR
jgi:S-formylglutathione hydrolase FrmB